MWRLAKAIVISWLIGVVSGVGMVIVVQRDNSTLPVSNASTQTAPQTSGAAPASSGETTR
jgi:hypothetical protein